MSIKEQFDHISKEYDKQRRQLIPCFDDYYHLPLSMLDYNGETPRILDIGSGTGLFSSILLTRYPNAQFTLIDLSDQMLAVAKKRFAQLHNFEYITADYTQHRFQQKFDIIISALSIHHLEAAHKKSLYQNCFEWLNPNGIFLNADQVLSPSCEIETAFSNLWKAAVQQSGLTEEEIQKAFERTGFDRPSTLAEQLEWLTAAGFSNVDILYKYLHFCVFYAKKAPL